MKYFPLIWSQLWRRKTRTILTLLSLITAFLLLGLLQAVDTIFSSGVDFVGASRLITQARVSFTSPLPLSLVPRIEAIPGVASVSWSQFFGGIYQDPKNFFPQFAVVPERMFAVYPEWVLPEEQKQAWLNTRTGVIVGKSLARRFGWKIGDRVPLKSQIFPQKNGSRDWTFDIVGIFTGRDEEWQKVDGRMYIRFDYFDEARLFGQGTGGVFVVRLKNPDQAEAVGQQIDRMTENSPDETKTQSERDFNLNFARQIGNIGLIVHAILGAVFFAILMLTGNTMSQAVRERIPELAILKTLGFSDGRVLALVLGESLLLCTLGGVLGMLLASEVMKVMGRLPIQFPPISANTQVWMIAAASMLLLGLAVGLPPALRAKRLNIVDALAGR